MWESRETEISCLFSGNQGLLLKLMPIYAVVWISSWRKLEPTENLAFLHSCLSFSLIKWKRKAFQELTFFGRQEQCLISGSVQTENVSQLSVLEMSYYIWQHSSCVHLGNFYPSCFPLLFFKIIVPIGRQAVEPILFGLH